MHCLSGRLIRWSTRCALALSDSLTLSRCAQGIQVHGSEGLQGSRSISSLLHSPSSFLRAIRAPKANHKQHTHLHPKHWPWCNTVDDGKDPEQPDEDEDDSDNNDIGGGARKHIEGGEGGSDGEDTGDKAEVHVQQYASL